MKRGTAARHLTRIRPALEPREAYTMNALLIVLTALLGATDANLSAPAPARGPLPEVVVEATRVAPVRAADWIADEDDNVCGLSDLRALSDPAKVDYDRLWDATPEIKKLKRDGIDPDSAAGIQLREEATDRIHEACKEIMEDDGHCSVWKKIRHRDGRSIEDITDDVEKKFPDDLA